MNFRQTAWGAAGDFVAPGDYDGDGKGDFVVYRNVNGSGVFLLNKSAGGSEYVYFGLPTDQINPGDYDGDGKTDIAVWRRANGTFYVRRSGDGGFQSQQWGQQGDYPVGYYNAH